MKKIILSAITISMLSACTMQGQRPTLTVSPEQVDRACIISAGNDLRRALNVEAQGGRSLPPPAGRDPVSERMVELDAKSAGVPVTYLFACSASDKGAWTAPIGRR